MTLEREELRTDWTAMLAEDATSGVPMGLPAGVRGTAIPATVPGQIHTDLERVGLVPDPTRNRDEELVRWVGQADWAYRRRIDVDPRGHDRVDLVADGLDTVASLSLDGVSIGSTRNMHRRYRFDLRDRTGGTNERTDRELEILFESPYRETERMADRFGSMPGPYDEPFAYVRKMASNFGWDWGLTCVTSGPWRPIAIERWSTARLRDVRPLVDVEAGEGVLDAHIAIERSGPTPAGATTADRDHDGEDDDLVLVVTVSGHDTKQRSRVTVTPKEDEAVVTVRIPDARLWWPRGYGEQALYDVEVQVQTTDGEVLDRDVFRTGFRSLRVDTQPDATGRPFTIVVNGAPIDVRGVNWIPDDVIVSRVDRARYAARLAQATACNANLVRVWGGGVYESRDFYEECDARGLLVWQDFLFACSAYPEGEPMRSEVIAEARDNVARLSRHPSLVVWNGNNENIWLHDDMGWAAELGDRPWGLDYYLDLLPTIVDAVDPSRFYTAASPWSGDERVYANDVDHETHHSWQVWNQIGDEHYRDSVPRFVSEFGWQAPPQWRTIREAVDDEPMTPTSPGVVHHQKAEDGMGKLARGLAPRFPVPQGDTDDVFDRWHYLTQLQQTRAIATGVEHWRTHWPHNTGVVVWQLNDLWPVASWSAVDGAGRPKPLFHELRRLYDDVLLAIVPIEPPAAGERDRPLDGRDRAADPGGAHPATLSLPVPGAADPATEPGRPTVGSDEEALGDLADTAVIDPGTVRGRRRDREADRRVPVEIAIRSSRRGLTTTVRVRRIDMSGRILQEVVLPVELAGPGVLRLAVPDHVGVVDDPAEELIVADMDWRRAVWTPLPDQEMHWRPAEYRVWVEDAASGSVLTVEAQGLVRDLLVQPDRVSPTGRVDRGFMTLLPGERVPFRLDGVRADRSAELVRAPVLLTLDRVLADEAAAASTR
ncbi:glycoside hydrolase family 2 protein [Curtobacterium sp. MCBD17_040]|uniref:glycoside hydrolase family 2 protein n=1 Tax=Curtobacterium sp. MCBD17_040 TaxID=2175674 RepID=UPI0015E880B4|nr:glycoside hydrolase family 2 protein [Curtobacterium sp. MCBD17_040]WIB64086.1 glycoside hydrolase family 2 protein [Curtobacterium sp. MCBD17_040]